MRVHVEFIVAHVSLKHQAQIATFIILLQCFHILLVLVLAFDSRVLLVYQI